MGGMTTPPADQALVDEAVDLARAAGEITMRYFRSRTLVIDDKADGTPVTVADREAERLVRSELARRHPHDGVVGEEEDDTPGTSGRRWIIDPIDGTKSFTHGVPLFANLVAVVDEHGPAVGVINLPALDEIVFAGRGLGCFADGEPAQVNDHASLHGAYLMTSGIDDWPAAALLAVVSSPMKLRTWADAYGYALVATGRAEAMVDHQAFVWDLAPVSLVVTEAGGRFTDLHGADRYDSGHGIATNGRIHDEVLAVLGTPSP
jgi:histidinol-phosphatase